MNIPNIIAIDGPAASGKSTLGERLADYLHYLYFDTGVMYRAVTLAAIRAHISLDDEIAVTRLASQVQIDVRPPSQKDDRKYDVLLNGKDITWQIRNSEIDANVSQVSTYIGVREAMTVQQRRIGQRGHVVMVGRDIGTVVLPEAALKIYLDASVEERARRRYRELCLRGEQVTFDQIYNSLIRRDQIDSTREVAPLKPAEDAVFINSDGLNEDEVFQIVKYLIE
ncbi:MAG TPA: (d)CMP kinase [Anaerolineaceae bacterium]|nr:(d)CMP kinase [Anaerolineaceae bacterium]